MLMLCAGLVAACSDTTLPFSKARDAPAARLPPEIAVSTITGLPEAQETSLVGALADAAAARGIGIGSGKVVDGYTLAGEFEPRATDAGMAVRYRWTLTDERGRVLHRIEETEAAGDSPDLDDVPVGRIAAFTAESLSSRLSQLGYATRAAGMPPPRDHLVQAGPGAEQEIDYETLHGPGKSRPSDTLTGEEPEVAENTPSEAENTPSEAENTPSEAENTPSEAENTPSGAEDDAIQGVAIIGVKGAGTTGNGELAGALTRVLTDAGWPVHKEPRGNSLMIDGDVILGQPKDEAQTVTLRWTVTAPDGQVMGAVEQANDVPAGSLDNGWGKAADDAALAAAQGIFDLVDKLR
ncbi:MAG: hypothetical protein ACOC71_04530 [Hyphomicrobiales bacterium]